MTVDGKITDGTDPYGITRDITFLPVTTGTTTLHFNDWLLADTDPVS